MNVPNFVNIDRVVLSYTHCQHTYRFFVIPFWVPLRVQETLKIIFPLKFDFYDNYTIFSTGERE